MCNFSRELSLPCLCLYPLIRGWCVCSATEDAGRQGTSKMREGNSPSPRSVWQQRRTQIPLAQTLISRLIQSPVLLTGKLPQPLKSVWFLGWWGWTSVVTFSSELLLTLKHLVQGSSSVFSPCQSLVPIPHHMNLDVEFNPFPYFSPSQPTKQQIKPSLIYLYE